MKKKLDCLYRFTKYGGKQCWDCPLVKDCIEESIRKDNTNAND